MSFKREKDIEPVVQSSLRYHFPGKAFVYKTHPDGYEGKGKPDLIGSLLSIYVGIELKRSPGRPSGHQKEWLRNINDAGGLGVVILWHEADECFYLVPPGEISGFSYRKRLTKWQVLRHVAFKGRVLMDLRPLRAYLYTRLSQSFAALNGEEK
jgi:hypothetical protein